MMNEKVVDTIDLGIKELVIINLPGGIKMKINDSGDIEYGNGGLFTRTTLKKLFVIDYNQD